MSVVDSVVKRSEQVGIAAAAAAAAHVGTADDEADTDAGDGLLEP